LPLATRNAKRDCANIPDDLSNLHELPIVSMQLTISKSVNPKHMRTIGKNKLACTYSGAKHHLRFHTLRTYLKSISYLGVKSITVNI
jgi:hypothetical protein